MKLVSVKNPRRVHKSVNAVSRVQAKERMERQHTELTTDTDQHEKSVKKSSNVHEGSPYVCMLCFKYCSTKMMQACSPTGGD